MTLLTKIIFAACAFVGSVHAQPYPNKPINLVVPFAPGGPTDTVARVMSEHMSKTLGQTVLVKNVSGAGGTTASLRLTKEAPDGYNILMGNLGTHVASMGLYTDLAYDPRTDFAPVINAAGTPMFIAANKDFPANTLQEFIALIKVNPGKYNYGSGGIGSTSHLTCIFFDTLVGGKVTHIPYRGSGPAMVALLAKDVDYVCDQSVGIIPQLSTIKTYAVATPTRLGVAPNVPTSAEAGLPKFLAVGWNAIFAPKETPREIIMKLNAAGRAALADPIVRKRLEDLGCIIPDEAGLSPEALGAHVKAEVDKWVPMIKAAGVTAE